MAVAAGAAPAGGFLLVGSSATLSFGSPAKLSFVSPATLSFGSLATFRHAKMAVAAGAALAGGFLLFGSSATLSFSSPGAPSTHTKTSSKGGGIVVAATTRAAVPASARFLASSKVRRLAVVAAGGASSAESPSVDCEMSQRPAALVSNPSDLLMKGAFGTAMDSSEMMEFLLGKVHVHRDVLKELITVGQGFITVELQAKEGYVKADALANVIQGLKLVGNTFFPAVNLPDYSAPVVPLSAEDVDKESFFTELINIFIVFYTALYWESHDKYEFRSTGAN